MHRENYVKFYESRMHMKVECSTHFTMRNNLLFQQIIHYTITLCFASARARTQCAHTDTHSSILNESRTLPMMFVNRTCIRRVGTQEQRRQKENNNFVNNINYYLFKELVRRTAQTQINTHTHIRTH